VLKQFISPLKEMNKECQDNFAKFDGTCISVDGLTNDEGSIIKYSLEKLWINIMEIIMHV
jgi:hypothetical protein